MSYISEAPVGVAAGLRSSWRLLSYHNAGAITAIVDCIVIVAASVAAGVGYHLLAWGIASDVRAFAGIGTNAALLFVLLAKSQGMYRPSVLRVLHARGIVVAWVAVLLAIVALLFLLKLGDSFSRGATLGFGVLGLGLLLGSRAVIANRLREVAAQGRMPGQRALIVGEREELGHYSSIDLLRQYGIDEIARFELPPREGEESPQTADNQAVLSAALSAARASEADVILLALRWTDLARYDFVRQWLRALPLPALLLPDHSVRSILAQQPLVEMGADFAVELQRAPLTFPEQALKRAFDALAAGALLVLLSPLLALVSIGIKLSSPGPVIFRQHRKGFNGRQFTIYKFRTMTVEENGSTIRQACLNDDRVTGFGALLRSTSIDELPQLLNVLRGEMSLVGPRPHAVAHDDEYSKVIANYAFRHHVKPGITGWAQVNGLRGETARLELMERRVDLDLWYINNWNLWLDLWILIRTCVVVPRSPHAY